MSTDAARVPASLPARPPGANAISESPSSVAEPGLGRVARRIALAGVAGLAAWVAGTVLIVVVLLIALGARPAVPDHAGRSASALAVTDIPPDYMELYQRAGTRFGLDWTILAAVGKVECDHGRLRSPACLQRGAENHAGAGGPAQFLAATWARYGVDGDGDGDRDRWDPVDAIPAMANYLRASGAPRDWRRALFAYNHAHWYVDRVLDLAERYRGALVASPGAELGVRRVPFDGVWLAPLPGTPHRCDARIVNDVLWIARRFSLTVTACFAASGHSRRGEHPLGLAIDAVPADGDWSHALAAAEAFGWTEACARTGCDGSLALPLRFVGFNGYPGHGDPAHCRCGAKAHIHFSWRHAPSAPQTPAAWVAAFATSPASLRFESASTSRAAPSR
jgi:hypothetical protein